MLKATSQPAAVVHRAEAPLHLPSLAVAMLNLDRSSSLRPDAPVPLESRDRRLDSPPSWLLSQRSAVVSLVSYQLHLDEYSTLASLAWPLHVHRVANWSAKASS
jgi:hypothetical protein